MLGLLASHTVLFSPLGCRHQGWEGGCSYLRDCFHFFFLGIWACTVEHLKEVRCFCSHSCMNIGLRANTGRTEAGSCSFHWVSYGGCWGVHKGNGTAKQLSSNVRDTDSALCCRSAAGKGRDISLTGVVEAKLVLLNMLAKRSTTELNFVQEMVSATF